MGGMDKTVIETFLAIVDTSSLAGAALALYVSPSAVSHRLDALEEELGVRLVERSRGVRRVELTVAGRRFESLAHEWVELDERMSGVSTEVETLKVGVPPSVAAYNLRGSLQRVADHSLFRLKLRIGRLDIEHLRERQIDLTVVGFPTLARDIVSEPLLSEGFRVVRGKTNDTLLQPDKSTPISVTDLDPMDQVYIGWFGQWQSWHARHWPAGVYIADVDSAHMLSTFLSTPQRWSVVPESVARGLAAEGFPAFLLAEPPPDRTLFWAYRRSSDEGTVTSIRKLQQIVREDLTT
ncbi:LysR family transcriptional regulator [Homoserinimonas sp. A447]